MEHISIPISGLHAEALSTHLMIVMKSAAHGKKESKIPPSDIDFLQQLDNIYQKFLTFSQQPDDESLHQIVLSLSEAKAFIEAFTKPQFKEVALAAPFYQQFSYQGYFQRIYAPFLREIGAAYVEALAKSNSPDQEPQFADATYIALVDLGSKANMSYRLKSLLNKHIDLNDYGTSIQSILFSPIIGDVFKPESRYNPKNKELTLEFHIDPQQALEATDAQFFILMREALLQAMTDYKLPRQFDFTRFKQDVEALKYEQLEKVD